VKRGVLLGVLALIGLVAGAVVGAAVDDNGPMPSNDAAVAPTAVVSSLDQPPAAAGDLLPVRTDADLLMAWTPGGLPAGFADAVASLEPVTATAVVAGNTVDLVASRDPAGMPVDVPPAGMAIPLDAIAVDPATYPDFVPEADGQRFRGLLPGEALLGTTSARLRGLAAGSQIDLAGGATVTVAGVVDDALVGAAELVVSTLGADSLGITTPRYVLVHAAGERAPLEAAIRSLADAAGQPVRVRAPGETPFLRSSDAVLPQALIKEVFGEFAYVRPPAGADVFVQEPAWATEHLVLADVALLGPIRCHEALLPALQGAMAELAERNLGHLVETFDGCVNPRLIAPGGAISRHAWGAAVDLNFSANRTAQASIQDDRLVAVMERWGFVSGDDWLVPDPGHFEYVAPPR
jgi:hypothetical protein